jgi:hypothetical protein
LRFAGASYTSDYVTAAFEDTEDRDHQTLDKLTTSEGQVFASGGNVFPFINIAGKYQVAGSQFDPAVLKGLSQAQIADALTDPASPVAKGGPRRGQRAHRGDLRSSRRPARGRLQQRRRRGRRTCARHCAGPTREQQGPK